MPLVIEVKVVPSSGRSVCILELSGRIKCYLKAPPERGKANAELVNMFAKALKIGKQCIEIITGATSALKRVRIDADVTKQDLYKALGLEQQLPIG